MTDDLLLPRRLRERPSFALIRLANLLRQECSDRLATVGLTMHQHAVLLVLEEFGAAVQKEVAARLSLDGGDLVSILDALQQSALLTRERDPRDRRRQILALTDAGRRLIEHAEKALNDPTGGVLKDLEPARRAELGHLAATVMAAHAPENWTEQN